MAEWSQMPEDLLRLIVRRLGTPFDVLRFRSVCSSWRSSVAPIPNPFWRGSLRIIPARGIRLRRVRLPLQAHHLPPRRPRSPAGGCSKLMNLRVLELGHEYVLRDSMDTDKVALLYLDNENDYALLTTSWYGNLAMFKSGERRWCSVPDMLSPYHDMSKGEFYALC
ncbi:hypothetical protein BT93_I1309 [Corymbia citriodora subsp. variegata]|nr:hypothetical protein BT93_I1309 [Corymbia citriodora subsp. variegata]